MASESTTGDPHLLDSRINVAYEMLNGWGGGIGEILGVSMFASLWVVCASILFLQSKEWPHWMGYLGFVVSIDLAINLLEMSISDRMPLSKCIAMLPVYVESSIVPSPQPHLTITIPNILPTMIPFSI